jgi:acid stress chaperone HdeB
VLTLKHLRVALKSLEEAGGTMFARTVVNLTISFMLIAPLSSQAQEIDMTSLKCREFVNSKQETATNIMLWLSGYFTYEDDAPIINISKIKNKENQLKQYCADNQDLTLLEASEIFMDKKYNQ